MICCKSPFGITNVNQSPPPQGILPFAVVGSTEEVKIGNKMVKARQYPWGVVQGKLPELRVEEGCNF